MASAEEPAGIRATVRSKRDQIVSCWERAFRELASSRGQVPPAVAGSIAPMLEEIAEIADELLAGRTPAAVSSHSRAHAHDLLSAGYEIGDVVAELAMVRECVLEATAQDRRRVLDRAIDWMMVTTVTHYTVAATERERAILARSRRAEQFLSEATTALGSSLDVSAALQSVAKSAVPELADAFCVSIIAPSKTERVAWAHRDARTHALLERLCAMDPAPIFPGPLVDAAIDSGKTTLLADASSLLRERDPIGSRDRRLLEALRPVSIVITPLLYNERRFGAFTFCLSEGGRRYDEQDVSIFEKLAYRAANALENARLYEEAKRAIANRDEILGVVAHDLKNPLSTIMLGAKLLTKMESFAGDEATVRAKCALIDRAASRMHRLICDLLDLGSIQAGHLKIERTETDAAPLVVEVTESFAARARERGVDLREDVEPSLPRILCDRDRIVQTLSNLVDNALKATSPGGTITLTASRREREVELAVVDTGSGISEEELANVFQRFWRGAKTGSKGTGRGLAIARAVVEEHGGRIWAESKLGAGTAFHVALPIDDAA